MCGRAAREARCAPTSSTTKFPHALAHCPVPEQQHMHLLGDPLQGCIMASHSVLSPDVPLVPGCGLCRD